MTPAPTSAPTSAPPRRLFLLPLLALLAVASRDAAEVEAALQAWDSQFFDDFSTVPLAPASLPPFPRPDPQRFRSRRDRDEYGAVVVADPLDAQNPCVSFNITTGGGDMWLASAVAHPFSALESARRGGPRRYLIEFDYLAIDANWTGFGGSAPVPTDPAQSDLGGFSLYGLDNGPPGSTCGPCANLTTNTRVWWLGSTGGYPVDPLENGLWNRFSRVVEYDTDASLLNRPTYDSGIVVGFQDYLNSANNLPGDVWFDNIRVSTNRWTFCGDGSCDADESCGANCTADCGACTTTGTTATTGSPALLTTTTTSTSISAFSTSSTSTIGTVSSTSSSLSPPPPPSDTATDEASPSGEPFPWWLIAAIAGGCCCCLILILVAVLVVRRRRNLERDPLREERRHQSTKRGHGTRASGSADDYIDMESMSPVVTSEQMVPVHVVAEENNYARIPSLADGGESVVGIYANLPAFQTPAQQKTPTSSGSLATGKSPSHDYANVGEVAARLDGEMLDIEDVVLTSREPLGRGQCGAVYKARYKESYCAVKLLKGDVSESALTEFYQEHRLIATLPPHANVVGYIGCTPDPFAIVMELCEAGSLKTYAKEHSLSLAQALKLFQQVAAGLAHLSEHGIVHRDVAARNILLAQDLTPKVADFGMSRSMSSISQEHHSKSMTGPLKWMSIETVRKGVYSQKSDVWAYAITCWEAVNHGADPFGKTPAVEYFRKVIKGDRVEFPDYLQEGVRELLLRCMAEKAEDRPSFTEIVDVFDRLEDEQEVVYASLSGFTVGQDFAEFRDTD